MHAEIVRLKGELARAGGQGRSDIRWTRDEGLHATLKFLGAVPARELAGVQDAIARATTSTAPFEVCVRGLGVFPSIANPRVIWVGLHSAALAELAHAVETSLIPLGFPAERRAFHPHITLGRVRGRGGWKAVEEILRIHWTGGFGVSPINHLTLYRSDLRPNGAVYTSLWTRAFANSRKG